MKDRTPSPRPRVAFGSVVPSSKGSRLPSGLPCSNESREPTPDQRPASPSSSRRTASRSRTPTPVNKNPTPDTQESKWKGGLPSEPNRSTKIKVTYSHIGSNGSDADIRSRLRETLSVSSVRIEPEDDGVGLSSAEVRLLADELSRVGRGVQVACQHLTLGFCQLDDDAAEKMGDALRYIPSYVCEREYVCVILCLRLYTNCHLCPRNFIRCTESGAFAITE